MKRILQIVGTMDRAGAETMVMNLYRAIDKDRFQFDFLYFTDKKCDFDEEIEQLGGNICRITVSNPIKRMIAVTKLLKENPHWQIVHSHTLFSNAFHIYAAYLAGVKMRIAHSHNTSDKSKNGLISWIYQSISRKIQSKYSTDFVACGVAAGKFLFPKKENVLVIPNSIDTNHFAEVSEMNKNYLKKEFDLDDDTLILLQLGRLNKVKNHHFTFLIIRELKKKDIKFKLFIAGQGELENELKHMVKELRLQNEIEFLGLRTDVPQLLAGANMMLMPSLYEGFPVVLVESQASGTEALIADTISQEVDLDIGLVHFESLTNKPEIWANKILEIKNYSHISKEERLTILKNKGFDIATNAKQLEQLYSS